MGKLSGITEFFGVETRKYEELISQAEPEILRTVFGVLMLKNSDDELRKLLTTPDNEIASSLIHWVNSQTVETSEKMKENNPSE